jgi:uncharacterized ferritin-like protein (DUF455 family)
MRTVLLTADPYAKVRAARLAARRWRRGELAHVFDVAMPDTPARPDAPVLLAPNKMARRGKGGTLAKRIALIHALAHIECVAIDLACDMIGRFGHRGPREFTDDWMRVAADEAMHFVLLDRRLRDVGSHYGALPAHDGLWEAARETSHDLLARLAIVPMVLEARGLDITPATIERMESVGDLRSAKILSRIYSDEINHVRYGTKWFDRLCIAANLDPPQHWKTLLKSHFRGGLKPPFNDSARVSAGLTQDYYLGIDSFTFDRQTGSHEVRGVRPS